MRNGSPVHKSGTDKRENKLYAVSSAFDRINIPKHKQNIINSRKYISG